MLTLLALASFLSSAALGTATGVTKTEHEFGEVLVVDADATPAPSPSVDCAGWISDDDELQRSFYENLTSEMALACHSGICRFPVREPQRRPLD